MTPRIATCIILLGARWAAAGELEVGKAHFFNTLSQVVEDSPGKAISASELQEFHAYTERDPLDGCWPELLKSVQAYLGVKVEGGFGRVAWESANGNQLRDDAAMEIKITYPGLQGLSIGQWDYRREADLDRWLCSIKLTASAVANLRDYVTLGRIKGYDLTDETAISNAISTIRGIAANFRQRDHQDLAVEADNLAGGFGEKLLEIKLSKGSFSVQPICDNCSERTCHETVGKLRAAGITVAPLLWEPVRRPVLYFSNEGILRVLAPILKDLEQSSHFPVEAVHSLTPTRNGYHANLLIADRITPYTDAKRALSGLFPSLCQPISMR